MDEERVVEEIVTKFLLNTCRLRTQLSWRAVQAVVFSAIAATTRLEDDAHYIPLTTGSVAEFYIEPMLSCIGDMDVMHHFSTQSDNSGEMKLNNYHIKTLMMWVCELTKRLVD